MHRAQPDALVFVNLLGGARSGWSGAMAWWGYPTYHEYVDAYVATVRPDLLCFDQYPRFGDCGWAVPGGDMNRSSDTRDL